MSTCTDCPEEADWMLDKHVYNAVPKATEPVGTASYPVCFSCMEKSRNAQHLSWRDKTITRWDNPRLIASLWPE